MTTVRVISKYNGIDLMPARHGIAKTSADTGRNVGRVLRWQRLVHSSDDTLEHAHVELSGRV
jgi:hypothetical protein